MQFEWDENKRLYNLAKHGYDFWDARIVFRQAPAVIGSLLPNLTETRLLAIGLLDGKFVTIVFTMRGEMIRIISMRRSRDDEILYYRRTRQTA